MMDIDKLVLTKTEIDNEVGAYSEESQKIWGGEAGHFKKADEVKALKSVYERISLATVKKAEPLIRQDTIREIAEWLRKRCRGYHAGNYGGQLGHFAIFRKEFEVLLRGEMPPDTKATVEKEG